MKKKKKKRIKKEEMQKGNGTETVFKINRDGIELSLKNFPPSFVITIIGFLTVCVYGILSLT